MNKKIQKFFLEKFSMLNKQVESSTMSVYSNDENQNLLKDVDKKLNKISQQKKD